MITVKQYAEDRNITIQAVHQSMKGKRKKGLLEGHVHLVDGIKWLDDEAVAILDKDRRKPPVIYERENANATIEQLRNDKELLLAKLAEVSEWKADNAMAIAEAEQTRRALTAAERDKQLLEGFVADAKAEIAVLSGEKVKAEEKARMEAEAAQAARDELTAAQERERLLKEYAAALNAWSALGWLKRKRTPKPVMPELMKED